MTHGWLTSGEPPTRPSLPAAATTIAPRCAAKSSAACSPRSPIGTAPENAALTFTIHAPASIASTIACASTAGSARGGSSSAKIGRTITRTPGQIPRAGVSRPAASIPATAVPCPQPTAPAIVHGHGRRAGRRPAMRPCQPGMIDRDRPVEDRDGQRVAAFAARHDRVQPARPQAVLSTDRSAMPPRSSPHGIALGMPTGSHGGQPCHGGLPTGGPALLGAVPLLSTTSKETVGWTSARA